MLFILYNIEGKCSGLTSLVMTKLMTTLTMTAIASILVIGGFTATTPNAFSTYGGNQGGDNDSQPEIPVGLCSDQDNLLVNGCFENPTVSTSQGWNLYEGQSLNEVPELDSIPGWDVTWAAETNPCLNGEPGFDSVGLLEIHRNILGGPAEGEQHVELDTDCNGPIDNDRSKEDASAIISQDIATSSEDEYEITFAYKAREGVKLKSNGLMVTWNDEDVTPDIKFSKKKWKYAITVPVSGIDGLSKLTFIDTGKSDSLGTFLDDVSVQKIEQPIPMGTITIVKNTIPDSSVGFTFDVTPTDEIASFSLTDDGTDSSNSITETVTAEQVYEITENDEMNYKLTDITCVGDENSSVNVDERKAIIDLQEGDDVTCTFTNEEIIPASLTLKKALTTDNGGTAEVSDWTMTLTNIEAGSTSIPFTSGQTHEDIPPGTYRITEELDPVLFPDGADDYSFVLIAGDTKCPSMLADDDDTDVTDLITLESGDNVTCIIYNDDNGDSSGGMGGPGGIIFQNNSMEIEFDEDGMPLDDKDSCDNLVTDSDGDGINDIPISPCVQGVGEDGNIGIVDSALTSTTTIVLFSVIEATLGQDGAKDAECNQERIIPHNSSSDILNDQNSGDSLIDNPTDNLMVLLGCSDLQPDNIYKVNYIMIDPDFGS